MTNLATAILSALACAAVAGHYAGRAIARYMAHPQ